MSKKEQEPRRHKKKEGEKDNESKEKKTHWGERAVSAVVFVTGLNLLVAGNLAAGLVASGVGVWMWRGSRR